MVIITSKLQCLKLLLFFSISYSMLASSMFLNSRDLTIIHFNQKFLQVNLAPKRLAQNISSSIIVRYLYYLRFHIDCGIDCEKAALANFFFSVTLPLQAVMTDFIKITCCIGNFNCLQPVPY